VPRTSLPQSRLVSLLLTIPAAALLWAAFPDTGIWWLAVLAVATLHLALRRDHAGWGFLIGFLTGVLFFLPLTRWASFATDLVPWLALGILGGLGFGLFGAAWAWARRIPLVRGNEWVGVVAFAALWTAVEQWRSTFPWSGFPWGRLAWATAGAPTGRAAWLGGASVTSFLVAGAAGLLVVAGRHAVTLLRRAHGQSVTRRHAGSLAISAIGALLALFGPLALPLPDAGLTDVANPPATAAIDVPDRSAWIDAGVATAEAGVLQVGAVQGNVPNIDGVSTGDFQQVLTNHLDGTLALADDISARQGANPADDQRLDVVLWPEDSSDLDPQMFAESADVLEQATAAVGAPLLVGTQEYLSAGGRFNVILLWQQGRVVAGRYAKQWPVAFGEYIPWRPFFRLLSDQVDRVNTDMIRAVNDPVIDVPAARLGGQVRLGVAICFEVAYDGILRDATALGAQALVVPTNNASFGFSEQSTQQLQMARIQAIANGRAVVQVSTNGVSAVIAPDGTLVARSGLFTADRFNVQVPLRTTRTPAVLAGRGIEWTFTGLGALLGLGGLCWGITTRVRRPAVRVPGA
jgi:apolipoprotein N-acyltransferase